MKPLHITGLGMIVGATALGILLAFVALRWQEASYPESSFVAAVQGEPAQSALTPAAKPGSLTAAQIAQAATRGKAIFDQKCAGCHTIGAGRTAGPDLKGVTQTRDRAWLTEFIQTPDKVIARNDPIAIKLKDEYGGLEMPNLGISAAQAEDLLYYVDSRSK